MKPIMKSKAIGYSILSALASGVMAAEAIPSMNTPIPELEAQVAEKEKSGTPDTLLLGILSHSYFASGQFAKGREINRKLITIYERERDPNKYSAYDLPYTISWWGDEEKEYAKDFAEAERLHLKALAIWDKEPATSVGRIQAHRQMVIFYNGIGNQTGAEKQTRELEKLMGTTDRSKLFPQPVCPGCGRG